MLSGLRPSLMHPASRAASCVNPNCWIPTVAPAPAAIDRARSSTAPRDAPTMRISRTSPSVPRASTNARASASRSSAADDSTSLMWE